MWSRCCLSFWFLFSVSFIGGPAHYSITEAPVALKHAGTLISFVRLCSFMFLLLYFPLCLCDDKAGFCWSTPGLTGM